MKIVLLFNLIQFLITSGLKINLNNQLDVVSNRVFYQKKPVKPYGQKYYEELMKKKRAKSIYPKITE